MAPLFRKSASSSNLNNNGTADYDDLTALQLLELAKKKIETGIFTRFFKRPGIVLFEIITYLITVFLFISALLIWQKIDNFFDAYDTIQFLKSYFSGTDGADSDDFSWISYSLLFILLLPSIISFLTGRLITASRKRINMFIQVEDLIDDACAKIKKSSAVWTCKNSSSILTISTPYCKYP